MRLGLHQITVNEVGAVGLIEAAAATGCEEVCLFTHIPGVKLPGDSSPALFPVVDRDGLPGVLTALRDHGVSVSNIEFFPVAADTDVRAYAEAFELGAAMGAKRAVTHIHDDHDARAVDTLGRLADLAVKHGLGLGLEFMGLTPACASIERALWFVQQAGRLNIGVAVDALHLVRTGGTAADVLAVPAGLFAYAQICDGVGLHASADYLPEALDRMMPGDGDFPLVEIVAALPAGIAVDVEVPSAKRIAAGLPALDHARKAVARSRELLKSIGASRA